MTTLKIYLTSNIELDVAKLCLKIYEQNDGKIIILTNNVNQSESISNKIWTFKKTCFLPSSTNYDQDIFAYVTSKVEDVENLIFPNIILVDLILSNKISELILNKNFKSICSFNYSEKSIDSLNLIELLANKKSIKINKWEFQKDEQTWMIKS